MKLTSRSRLLLSGNEAIARGAYESGVTVATSYPGTPCTEILEGLSTYAAVQAMWSTNEKVAYEVALGASFAGARALVAMKHVGLNVAADPMFSSAYTGINGGMVVVVGDDPSAHSSQNEQDSRHYARAAKLPMLEPSDSQEAKDFVIAAFELSEKYDTPVLLRVTTRICHSKTVVDIDAPAEEHRGATGFVRDFDKYVLLPRQAVQRHAVIENRLQALAEHGESSHLNRVEIRDRSLGIVTSGIVYTYVREAFPEASILKLGQTFPLPAELIREFAANVDRLMVIEELDPFLEEQIRALGVEVEGSGWMPRVGELTPERILRSVEKQSPQPLEKGDLGIATRVPRICAGCQYLGIFTAISRIGVRLAGDIGCYTLGALEPWNAIDSVVCMGASIGTALGMEKALGKESHGKIMAVIGDSTLLHSGIAPLLDLVYNQGHSTILVMDNSTTAMTGLQGHAGNGRTAKGMPARIDLEKLIEAIGIEWIRVVDPYDLEESEAILREALEYPGPSVVISRAPCLFLKPKKLVQQAHLSEEACTGCGECFKVGCVAIDREDLEGRVVPRINLDLCVGCTLCVQSCPEGALAPQTVAPGPRGDLGMEAPIQFPVTTLIAGVGGQGVVLAGDTLAEAALLAGLNVKKSEIHGLSRRFGSVSCQVRVGRELHSPLRGHGSVDLLVALEGYDGLRHLPFLRDEGSALINRLWRNPRAMTPADDVAPPFVDDPRIQWFDGSDLTHQAECPRSLNFFMLGVLSTRLMVPEECWQEALNSLAGKSSRDANREMFLAGRRLGQPQGTCTPAG